MKPTLPMYQLPIFRVRRRDLEQFAHRVYRLELDFLAATGTVAGLCPEYLVENKVPVSLSDQASQIRRGRRTRNVALLLTALCEDGYIPAGMYVVDTHPSPPALQVYRRLLQETEDPDDPRCVAFRQAHRQNRLFMQQHGVLDRMVRELKKQAS